MALLSDRYRFWFLVNPKTASTAMRRCLRRHVPDNVFLRDRVAALGITVDYQFEPHHNNARVKSSVSCFEKISS